MQTPSMQLDVAADLLQKARDSLMSYKNKGISDVLTTAKALCNEMKTDAEWFRTTKRHFAYEY